MRSAGARGGAPQLIGILIATLCATAGGAATETAPHSTPLLDYAASLHFDSMANEGDYRGRLQAASHELERNPPPAEDCARTLGASRYSDSYAQLASAQAGLGEHVAAADAYAHAIACAPRTAELRGNYALELMNTARYPQARAAARRGLDIDADDYDSAAALAQLDFLEGNWADAATRMRGLAGSAEGLDLSMYWQIMLWLAQRRAGNSAPELHARALAADWPRPVLEFLRGSQTETDVLTAIKEKRDPQRRREMLCEALFYIGEADFARGAAALGERRLAAAINLRVLSFSEHQLAVAELRKVHAHPDNHAGT
jgi:hypothetical protein